MTSLVQLAGNRRNARHSTGPRTTAGKHKAAGNARRHGLTGRLVKGSAAFRRAEELARAMLAAGNYDVDVEVFVHAYAEAQVKLGLIRQQRRACLDALINSQTADPSETTIDSVDRADILSDLEKLTRYERLARCSRNKTLQRFDTNGLIIKSSDSL